MSSVVSTVTLTELTFPDITGKTIKGWGTVSFSSGTYTSGGLTMGLINWLDARTVDFNSFLRCDVWGEDPVTASVGNKYHYSPVGDLLQIFTYAGVELANGAAIPASVLNDVVMFEVTVDRTTVRG
jgi:hypothetical protein